MLTLNEIRNVNFRKSNFGGYRAEDVEAFIDEVQLSYDSLLKENAELLKRLESLTSKLEEYQREEDSIRNALMNAQKVGDASLRDAKHKAEIILKDATIKAEKIVSNAQMEIHREREIIERMQRDIADFKARLLRAYKEHLAMINGIPSEGIMSQETRDMVSSVPLLDRDTTAYQANMGDYPQDDYPAPDRRGGESYPDRRGGDPYADRRGGDFGSRGGDDRTYGRDAQDSQGGDMYADPRGAGPQEPVMPRERMSQSRGGFTVNIDEGASTPITTTLPPPMREQRKYSAFDAAAQGSYDDSSDDGAGDRTPIGGDDSSYGGGQYQDPESLMGGGNQDFRTPTFDQDRGRQQDGGDRSFRRRFNS